MSETPTPRDLVESGAIGGTRVDDGGRPVVDDGGRPLTYDSPSADEIEGRDGRAFDDGMKEGDDPSDYTVDEVKAYLSTLDDDQDGDEIERVLTVERGAKARTGILGD